MGYPWQKQEWPIEPGTEITADHMEDLRFFLWGHFNLEAGVVYRDYAGGCLTASTWAAFCSSLNPADFPMSGGHSDIVDIMYKGANESEGDLYSSHFGFLSIAVMTANPPCDADGVMNAGFWRLAPDPNYYHDWDFNSGRRVVRRTVDGSGGDLREHTLDVPAWQYYPKDADPATQQTRYKFLDTLRTIPNIKYPFVPLDPTYLSQPETMGARYHLDVLHINDNNHRWTKFSLDKELALDGKQYAVFNGEPGSDAGERGVNQFFYDMKICEAYQNAIERVCNLKDWCWPLDSDEGSRWIANYNAAMLEPYDVDTIDDWTAGTYAENDRVMYTGRVVQALWTTSQEPDPEDWYNSGWVVMTPLYGDELTDPTAVSITHEYWGCNESGLEFCLWALGRRDFYYDSTYVYKPYTVALQQHIYEADLEIDPSDVYTAYPNPDGTWRGTWMHSCGFISDVMRPGEMGEPTMQRYSDFQETSGDAVAGRYWFSGGCRITEPDTTLTEAQQAMLDRRHGYTSETAFEVVREMLNDMWNVLSMLKYNHDSGATIVLAENNTAQSTDVLTSASDGQLFRDAVSAAEDNYDEDDWTDEATAIEGYYSSMSWVNEGGWKWKHGAGGGNTLIGQVGIRFIGSAAAGRYLSEEIMIRLGCRSVLSEISTNPKRLYHTPEFNIGLLDGSVQTFQSRMETSSSDVDPYVPRDIAFEPDIYDGVAEKIKEINYASALPVPSAATPPSETGWTQVVQTQAEFLIYGVQHAPGNVYYFLGFAFDEDVYTKIRHRQHIEIDNDITLFNDNGYLR